MLLRSVAFVDTATGRKYIDGAAAGSQLDRVTGAIDVAIALAGAVVLFLASRRRLAYVWVAVLCSAPFAFSVDVGPTTLTLPKAVLIASIVVLLREVRRIPLELRELRLVTALFGAFILITVVSLPAAAEPGAVLREALKSLQYFASFAVVFCAYRRDPDENLLRMALAAVVAIVALTAFFDFVHGAAQSRFVMGHAIPRVGGALEGPNQLAAFLALLMLPMGALALLRRPAMRIEICALILGSVALVLTFSVAGVATAVFGAVCLALALRFPNARSGVETVFSAAIVLLAAVSIAVGLFPPHGFETHLFGVASGEYAGGLGTRNELWHAAAQMFRAHPLVGIGAGNFESQVGQLVTGVHTHANALVWQLLTEEGLLGLAAWIVLVACVLVPVARTKDTVGIGVTFSALAFLMHNAVDTLLIYPKVGVTFWALAGIGYAIAAGSGESRDAGSSAQGAMTT